MKYARDQIRLLIAEFLLGVALWFVPKDSAEAVHMTRCVQEYVEIVSG